MTAIRIDWEVGMKVYRVMNHEAAGEDVEVGRVYVFRGHAMLETGAGETLEQKRYRDKVAALAALRVNKGLPNVYLES